MIFETTFIDHLIIGLLKKYRKLILRIDRSDKRLRFVKHVMVAEGVEKYGISGCVDEQLVKQWDKGEMYTLVEFREKFDKKYKKKLAKKKKKKK